jgi:hypothetical protein
MAGQFIGGRWFERASDGVVFRMDDPDHIKRMLAEGWREVDGPHAPTPLSVVEPPTDHLTPDTPEVIQARNDAALEGFGVTPKPQRPPAKLIRKAKGTTKER